MLATESVPHTDMNVSVPNISELIYYSPDGQWCNIPTLIYTQFCKEIVRLTHELTQAQEFVKNAQEEINQKDLLCDQYINQRQSLFVQLDTECKEKLSTKQQELDQVQGELNRLKEQQLEQVSKTSKSLLSQSAARQLVLQQQLDGKEKELVKLQQDLVTVQQALQTSQADHDLIKKQSNQLAQEKTIAEQSVNHWKEQYDLNVKSSRSQVDMLNKQIQGLNVKITQLQKSKEKQVKNDKVAHESRWSEYARAHLDLHKTIETERSQQITIIRELVNEQERVVKALPVHLQIQEEKKLAVEKDCLIVRTMKELYGTWEESHRSEMIKVVRLLELALEHMSHPIEQQPTVTKEQLTGYLNSYLGSPNHRRYTSRSSSKTASNEKPIDQSASQSIKQSVDKQDEKQHDTNDQHEKKPTVRKILQRKNPNNKSIS